MKTSCFVVQRTTFFWRTGIPCSFGSRYSITAIELISDDFMSFTSSWDNPSTRFRKNSGQVLLSAPSLDSSKVTDKIIPVFALLAKRYSRPSDLGPADSTANPGESILTSQLLSGNEALTLSFGWVSCDCSRAELPSASIQTTHDAVLHFIVALPNKYQEIILDRARMWCLASRVVNLGISR